MSWFFHGDETCFHCPFCTNNEALCDSNVPWDEKASILRGSFLLVNESFTRCQYLVIGMSLVVIWEPLAVNFLSRRRDQIGLAQFGVIRRKNDRI